VPLLTPALALAYLRELSLDVRAAVVLGPRGERLAGDAALAEPARAALAAGEGVRRAPAPQGTLLAARRPDGTAIAVVAGPQALLELVAHDLEQVLGDLSET